MIFACLKFASAFLLFIPALVLTATPVYADRTINSVTLNDSSSVTVVPSAPITASVNVTIDKNNNTNWRSTSWNITGSNCVNHTNHGQGTYTENFTVTAPDSTGTYDISFIAYQNDECNLGSSSTYTLTGGIIVVSPTPTPTPTPTNTPTPTPTPTAGPTATPTPTPSIYYPSVVLTPYIPNPTNQALLTFFGKANIEQGTISAVEFSVDESPNWQQASPVDKSFNSRSENFTFTTPSLIDGQHTMLVRAKSNADVYTQESLYEILEVLVITTKPIVVLDSISEIPTKNQTQTISGTVTVSDLTTIAKVEVSNDNKRTWFAADVKDNSFSFTFKNLDDGNYSITARAADAVGNAGESATQTLIVDTIPPILGGAITTFGNQTLTPNLDGAIQAVAGIPIRMILSFKGGITQAAIRANNESFELKHIQGTNLWTTTLLFKTAGENFLILSAQDGAFNKIEKKLQTIFVDAPGKVHNSKTRSLLTKVKISVFYFDFISKTWVLWDGEAFGQKNPFTASSDGTYSFMVPAGKYYIEASLPGFNTLQSEILDFSKTSLINFDLPLESKPHIAITLPLIGRITFSFPPFSQPQTLPVLQKGESITSQVPITHSTQALPFSLPDKNNNPVTLSSMLGKKVLLTFLAPWSSHAVDQASILSKINQNITAGQLMYGIIVQESPATTVIFMKSGQYQFPYLVDEDGITANNYNVTALPQHVFIDSKGIIREVISGVLDGPTILEKLNQLQ